MTHRNVLLGTALLGTAFALLLSGSTWADRPRPPELPKPPQITYPKINNTVGYRVDPRWLYGVYTEGVVYRPGEGSFGDRRSFAFAAGVQTQWHALPFARFVEIAEAAHLPFVSHPRRVADALVALHG